MQGLMGLLCLNMRYGAKRINNELKKLKTIAIDETNVIRWYFTKKVPNGKTKITR
jgi:intein-encoded DNA endonuclease-like protein